VEEAIDQFILYLAAERGLSTNYQLSTRRSLEVFAKWLSGVARISKLENIEPGHFRTIWRGGSAPAWPRPRSNLRRLRSASSFDFSSREKFFPTTPQKTFPSHD
jgi:site-specific recombinase XerD